MENLENKTKEKLLKEVESLKAKVAQLEDTESKLRESEEKFKTLITNAEEIVYIIDKDGTFLLSEGKGLSKMGIKPGEVVGQSVFELYKDFPDMLDEIRRAFKGETITSEVKIGDIFFRNWYTPQKNDKGEIIGLFGLSVNITDQKSMEEKLLLTDERYHLATTASDNGIWDWWIESNKVFFSDQWKAQLGYKPDEIENEFKSWEDLLHPDDKDQMIQEVMNFLASPSEYFRAEFRMNHKDGSYRWIFNKAAAVLNEDGKVIRMFGAHTDISDRKNAEEKVIEEKNKAQQYLDIVDVMMISVDSSGMVKLVNPKGCEILGYSEEEIVGHNWFDNFLPERMRENVKEVSKKVFSGEMESVKYYENEILTKSGDEKIIAWHNAVYKDDNGKVIGTLSSGEDITERKLSEDKLHESLKREQALADIVRNTPVAMAIGYPTGSLANVNEAFTLLTGYSEEELKSINWNSTLTPQKWNAIEAEELKKLNPDNNSIRYEKEYIHKKGNIIPIELVVTAKFDDDNNLLHFIGFITDITERKLAEEKLAKHQEHLEELVKERTLEVDEKNKKLSDQMKIFVGREIKIRDLENKIKVLQGK